MRDFRKLKVWQDGILLVKKIYQLSDELPSNEKYGLKSQITRSAVSIPSNIAEGNSRNSETEYKRFLEIAMGSLYELETQLTIILELGFATNEQLNPLFELIVKEEKMLGGLIRKLKNNI